MTCRKPLYSRSDVSEPPKSPRSPKINANNQTGSESPSRPKYQQEMYASSEESENEENSPNTTRATEENSSLQQSGYSSAAVTPNRPASPPQKQLPMQSPKSPKNNQQSSLNIKLIAFIIILSVLSVPAYKYCKQPKKKGCTFEQLRHLQPLQSSDVWEALSVNIELQLNKTIESPNIYLFLHSSHSNVHQIEKLIQNIALETSKCFGGERPIEMSLKDFETKIGDDYGYPITQYKNKLKQGNVFLIVNLNDIPPNSARALHTICDTYSPIERDVVIFLTLRTNHSTFGRSPAQLAYQTLREIWKEVPDNELDALITRVSDQVLFLKT